MFERKQREQGIRRMYEVKSRPLRINLGAGRFFFRANAAQPAYDWSLQLHPLTYLQTRFAYNSPRQQQQLPVSSSPLSAGVRYQGTEKHTPSALSATIANLRERTHGLTHLAFTSAVLNGDKVPHQGHRPVNLVSKA